MAKKLFLLVAVVASLAFTVSAWAYDHYPYGDTVTSWHEFYYTFAHQYLPTTMATNADTGDPQGLFTVYDNAMDSVNLILTSNPLSINDDATLPTVSYTITNKDAVILRPDAFSFNCYDEEGLGHISITHWLESPYRNLLYTTAERYGPTGLDQWQYGADDDIRLLTGGSPSEGPYIGVNVYYGEEGIIKHAEPLVGANGSQISDATLGLPDLLVDHNGIVQGRLQRGNELALADFMLTTMAPDGDARIYFSGGRYGAYRFGGGYYGWRPGVVWTGGLGPTLYAGSDFGGRANAGDILTAATLVSDVSFGVFEQAWKIAGTMLGDKFWLPANGSLVWNNANGYVSTSTAAGAAESAGHLAMKNFMRFIFDITAMKVEDVNGDGKYNSSTDKVLFTLQSDRFYIAGITQWGNVTGWFSDVQVLRGQFFPGGLGDAIYLYQGDSVTTYMDRDSNMFFGLSQNTTNVSIWGERYGDYNITGFDLTTFIPEPTTMILMIGMGLALGAGILRKRMR